MTNPVSVQSDFRIRNDDGSQTTATWVAAQNTNASLFTDTNYRIRFNIRETAARNLLLNAQLEYNLNGAGYNTVDDTSAVVRSSASTQFTDGTATTEQLAGAGTFLAGSMDEVDGQTAGVTINNQDTEMEYCFQIRSADVTSGQTLQLRITDAGTVLTTYSQTPTITALIPVVADPTSGSIAFIGNGVEITKYVFPLTGALLLTGEQPSPVIAVTVLPAAGSLVLSGGLPLSKAVVLIQDSYRLRNDDGSEVTATWKAGQNATAAFAARVNFRIRFIVDTRADPSARNFKLEYQEVSASEWTAVDNET